MIHDFYMLHPVWSWLTVAAILLAAEVATGTGWLLWPSASAAITAVVAYATRKLGLPGEAVAFAVLTIVSTLAAKTLLPKKTLQTGPDINDRAGELVGKTGKAVGAFAGGQGRVMVDGAEWAAEAQGALPHAGDRVEVLGVFGAKLSVRAL
ncbi:MAG: NfeD family protein [Caulobacteraceae bacterium]|nr:NfeD family protein [Caulobacteraceae bacterium]